MAKKSAEQFGLRDHREALRLAVDDLPPVVAATGDCEYLRAQAVDTLRNAWLERFPQGDTVVLRGMGEAKPLSLADITGELAGGSLFAREKLVLVRQAERVLFPQTRGGDGEADATGKAGEREKAFVAALERPATGVTMILETAQLLRNRTLGKKVAEYAALIPCPNPTPREIPEWLAGRARQAGLQLDAEAADLLQRAHGTDLGVLAAELDKLALYAGEGGTIDAGVVGEFLTGTVEFDIFNFTNAVEARNARAAAYYARRITMQGSRDQRGKREDGERSAHRIMFMLAGSASLMLRARVAKAAGLGPAEFAAEAKQSPWRADKLYAAASRYSFPELRHMVTYAAEQIRRAHDTGGDAMLALELMAVRFTNGNFP